VHPSIEPHYSREDTLQDSAIAKALAEEYDQEDELDGVKDSILWRDNPSPKQPRRARQRSLREQQESEDHVAQVLSLTRKGDEERRQLQLEEEASIAQLRWREKEEERAKVRQQHKDDLDRVNLDRAIKQAEQDQQDKLIQRMGNLATSQTGGSSLHGSVTILPRPVNQGIDYTKVEGECSTGFICTDPTCQAKESETCRHLEKTEKVEPEEWSKVTRKSQKPRKKHMGYYSSSSATSDGSSRFSRGSKPNPVPRRHVSGIDTSDTDASVRIQWTNQGLEETGTERDQAERVKAAELTIKDLVDSYPATRNDLPAFQEFRAQLNAIQLHSKIVAVLRKGPWTSVDLAETIVWRKLPSKYLRDFQQRCQDEEWKAKYTRSLYQLSKWIGEQVIAKSTIDAAEEKLRSGMHQGLNEEVYIFAQRVEDQAVLAGMAGRDFSGELPRSFIKGLIPVVRGVNFQYYVEHALSKGRHKMNWRKTRSSAKSRWKFWRQLRKRVEKEYLAQVPTRDEIHERGYASPSRGASAWSGRFKRGSAKLVSDQEPEHEHDQAYFVKRWTNQLTRPE
jgi:hypothetical protein